MVQFETLHLQYFKYSAFQFVINAFATKQVHGYKVLGPVVQSMVSFTSSLRGQLVKCFTTLSPKTLKFFVEKMREAFALQKLLTFFQQKILAYLRYYRLKF